MLKIADPLDLFALSALHRLHPTTGRATNLLTGGGRPPPWSASPAVSRNEGDDERTPEASTLAAMTYFFFGTLMDRDVLAAVLDRPVPEGELQQAWLHGYRRVRAATACYPILLPAPGLVVGGVLFHPRSARDDVRIRHFEDEEYVDRWRVAQLPGGRRLAARVFFSLETLGCTDHPWSLAEWAPQHKVAFLEQCREWMLDCPACESDASADPGRGAMVAAGWRRAPPRR